MVSFHSPYYPYEKVTPGFSTFRGAEEIPMTVTRYLLDLPDAAGYTPEDDNRRPRVRIAKYLWHDSAQPLTQPLPSPSEKLSMVFDPTLPVLDGIDSVELHPKGYRIYPQEFWGQTQTDAQTTLKIYLGRIRAQTNMRAEIGVVFQILSNVNLEGNTRSRAYSRCYAIEQAIVESLNGVNLTGIGTFHFDIQSHGDNGSRPIADEGTNVGRTVHMSVTWMDGAGTGPVEEGDF